MPQVAVVAVFAVAAAASAYASYSSSQAQKQASQFEADQSKQNASLAELQARDAEERGRLEEDQYRRQLAQLQGDQRVALAGTGGELSSGSALALQEDTAELGTLDAAMIRQNAAKEAWQARVGGANALSQSNLASATAAGISPGRAAGVSLLQSASSYANSWYGKQPAGGGTGTTGAQGSGLGGTGGGFVAGQSTGKNVQLFPWASKR